MVQTIAYTLILGKPVIMYMGILTYLSFIFTATIGYLNFKGNAIIPFKWHPRMAITSITLATLHAILGLSVYFNF
ncbi:MAG: hypothetical protein WC858_05890 [Parcubacteria group bacterium]|jgi:hypothetical protein